MIPPKLGDIIKQTMRPGAARRAEFYEILDHVNCKAFAMQRTSGDRIYRYSNQTPHKWKIHSDGKLYVSGLSNWMLAEIQQKPHDEECCILDEAGLFELWCWLSPILETLK